MSCFLSSLKELDKKSLINFKEKLKSTDILNNYIFNNKKKHHLNNLNYFVKYIYQYFMTWLNVLVHSILEHPIYIAAAL